MERPNAIRTNRSSPAAQHNAPYISELRLDPGVGPGSETEGICIRSRCRGPARMVLYAGAKQYNTNATPRKRPARPFLNPKPDLLPTMNELRVFISSTFRDLH
jgi:hypothetical protein